MDDTGIMREICSNLLLRLDAFLGVQDVTDTSFWPNESKRLEDKVSTDRLFLETRGILDDYNKTGLNPGFVVERVNIYYNRSETDQGWEFFFKGYEDLFVRIRRHENEHWVSFQRDFLLQSKSKTETYKSFGTTQGADFRTCVIHFMKILCVAFVMVKRRGYQMQGCIVYDSTAQCCTVIFHAITSHIWMEMKLNSDVRNAAVELKRYSKKRLDSSEWPASEKDLPSSFVDLNALEKYVKAH